MEVNSAPSLSTPTNLDEEIKECVLMEAETDDFTFQHWKDASECVVFCSFRKLRKELDSSRSASSTVTVLLTCLNHGFYMF